MLNSKRTTFAAVLLLVTSLAAIVFSFVSLPPAFDSTIHKEIGRAMAREALTLRKEGAGVIVIKRDTVEFPQPASDFQFKAFKKELAKTHVPILSVQEIQLDPLRPLEVPAGDFLNLIRKAPAGSVIVSFMGPPLLSDEQKKSLKGIPPKIVAFCSGNITERTDIQALFKEGLLHSAIASRHLSAEHGKIPGALPDFNQLYVILNGSNLSTMLKEVIAYAQ
jgi:hypothetical protein